MAAAARIRAIDGDGHVRETGPNATIHEYLEQPYRDYAGKPIAGLLPGLVPTDGWFRLLGGRLGPGPGNTVEDWVSKMDEAGMDIAVLYPTLGLFAGFIRDPDYKVAFCRAWNSWVVDTMCRPAEERLKAVALLPPQDTEEAAKELRRAKGLGLVGCMLPADGGHLLGHRQFHPVYQAASEEGLPLAVHASGSHLHATGLEDFPKFIQTHTLSHPSGIMRQFTSLMFDGAFDLFPSVRFAFLEAGVSWCPGCWTAWTRSMSSGGSPRPRCFAASLPSMSGPARISSLAVRWARACFVPLWSGSGGISSCSPVTTHTGTVSSHTPCAVWSSGRI